MSGLSITQTDIKKSLDILTLQENGDMGNIKENIFDPLALGFGGIGAVQAYRNNSGLYLSRCENRAARRSLSKLMEIDTGYLNKMCTSKDIAVATRAQLLKGQIGIAKRAGMTNEMAENILKEFELLSKQYYKKGLGKVATKVPELHRTWKSQGGKMMLLLGLGMELMNIIPAFKESTGAGIKQTGKSTGKILLNTGGWIGGAAAGAILGSFIPGAGTVVGGIIGAMATFLGGSLGMFGADKLSEAVGLTKSEAVTVANEKQSKENEKTAKSLMSGDEAALLAFADQLNSWIAENDILDENGNLKEKLPKDIKQEYEQLIQTASALGLTTA